MNLFIWVGDTMTSGKDEMRIVSALTRMGLSEEAIKSIENEIDDFASKVINAHSLQDIKTFFDTIKYIYIAQNIREYGVASKNIPESVLRTLKTTEFVQDSHWSSLRNFRSFRLTKKGNSIAKEFVKDILSKLELVSISGINPFTLMYILDKREISMPFQGRCPSAYETDHYLLHQISNKFFDDCVRVMAFLEEKGLSVRVNQYVSTRGGELREETYLVLPDLTPEYFEEKLDTTDYSKLIQSYTELYDKLVKRTARNSILKVLQDESLINAYNFESYSNIYNSELIHVLEEIETSGSIILKDDIKQGQICSNPLFVVDKGKFLQKVRELSRNNTSTIEKLLKSIDTLPIGTQKSSEKKALGEVNKKKQTEDATIQTKDAIILGSESKPSQYGVIGRCDGNNVLIDLNSPHIVFVSGMMGAGKGYTIGVISEMLVSDGIENLSHIGKKATIIVLYKPKDDTPSEFLSIRYPNAVREEIEELEEYAAHPTAPINESQFRIFVDPGVFNKIGDQFGEEYNTKCVFPLHIDPTTLVGEDWATALMSSGSSDALYIKVIFGIIRNLRDNFTLEDIIHGIEGSEKLEDRQKKLACLRIKILGEYFGENDFMKNLAIGGVNIIDFRKALYMPEDIFSIMTLIISKLQHKNEFEDEPFVFVMNEAHLYFKKGISNDFVETIENLIRRKRHGANWLLLDTHLPEDVDPNVIKLSDLKFIHHTDKTVDSKTLKLILEGSTGKLYQLKTGEAIAYANKSSLDSSVPIKIKIRPRVSKHGGATKTAIGDNT